MKSLVDQLGQYAVYHRDARNIVSHLIGIPLIVVAVATLLARPALGVTGTLSVSPAMLLAAAVAVFYLRLDIRFGILMTLLLALSVWAGKLLAMQTTGLWLAWGLGLFFVGWVIQFIGHYFEGSKPAFVDDVIGLAVGPLFIVAELAFFLGLRDPFGARWKNVLAPFTAVPARELFDDRQPFVWRRWQHSFRNLGFTPNSTIIPCAVCY